MNSRNILVFDLIPFQGGSKVATRHILSQLDISGKRLVVLTNDKHSWRGVSGDVVGIIEPGCLKDKEFGIPFFIRQAIIFLNIFLLAIRFGQFYMVVGTSGPGVDYALYWYKKVFNVVYCQFVHGPVACSNSIGRAIYQTNFLGFLSICRQSLRNAMLRVSTEDNTQAFLQSKKCVEFVNGLPAEQWPSPTQAKSASVFWAASLLKWKGMSVFEEAVHETLKHVKFSTKICFIRPEFSQLEVDPVPKENNWISVYESPENLDEIRRSCSIFVSTSDNEPFGLSILEALAAGLCVVIPADGAYWDGVLTHGENCIKYTPGCAENLSDVLTCLTSTLTEVDRIGVNGRTIAEKYRCENVYAKIVQVLEEHIDGDFSNVAEQGDYR